MLKRKMFRDIRKNLSQFITIFLMTMIGIMVYSGIKAYMGGMQKTSDKFYSENNLASKLVKLYSSDYKKFSKDTIINKLSIIEKTININ